MIKSRTLIGAAAIAALVGAYAFAQTIAPQALSGNECWDAGQGPGGPSTGYLCVNIVRGGTPQVTQTITGSTTLAGASADGGNYLITAQPSAATITMPANPVPDGAIVGVCNVTGSAWATNVVTLAANSGQTLSVAATLTTLAAGVCAREQWNQATATWYRVQ